VIEEVPTPQANKKIATSTQVTLTIGSGPQTVKVPDVTGFSRDAAKSTLELHHLKARFTEVDSENAKGTVVDTDPEKGSELAIDSTVTVHISKGNETKVPSVVGKMQSEAEQQLRNAGFTDITVQPDTESSEKQGTVTSQTPNGGEFAVRGSQVTITVAVGQSKSPSPTGSASPSPSETPSSTPSSPGFPFPTDGGGGD
jgi:serine/threonine-protein kinase